MQLKNKELWDNVWKKKKYITDYQLRFYEYLAKIRDNNLNSNSKVLEVGCGSGGGLEVFKKFECYGLDISNESLKVCKEKGIKTINCDARAIEFNDNIFDFTYSSGLVEHFNPSDRKKIIHEMIRVTKPNGLVLVIIPNKFCLWYRIYKSVFTLLKKWKYGFEDNLSYFDLKKDLPNNVKILKKVGIQIIIPFATDEKEMLKIGIRKKLIILDKLFPLKHLIGYGTGFLLIKLKPSINK
ncbi:class I SAM-dependent methyltransferase [Candidatus Woesearchaeota archaeon]|nr:class I SAM-dependent methyltransferase [Candidatus Woesearchaeota archaeon]